MVQGKHKCVIPYGIIRNLMINADYSRNFVSLVSRWYYYVGIDLNGNRNIIKWIVIIVDKLCWDLYAFIIWLNCVWAQMRFMENKLFW